MPKIIRPLRDSVEDWAGYTAERLVGNVIRERAIKTAFLRDHISYQIEENNENLRVSFFFPDYGRFVDMRSKAWYNRTMYGRFVGLLNIAQANLKERIFNIFR